MIGFLRGNGVGNIILSFSKTATEPALPRSFPHSAPGGWWKRTRNGKWIKTCQHQNDTLLLHQRGSANHHPNMSNVSTWWYQWWLGPSVRLSDKAPKSAKLQAKTILVWFNFMKLNLSTFWETSKKDLILHLSQSKIVQTKGRCTPSKIRFFFWKSGHW